VPGSAAGWNEELVELIGGCVAGGDEDGHPGSPQSANSGPTLYSGRASQRSPPRMAYSARWADLRMQRWIVSRA